MMAALLMAHPSVMSRFVGTNRVAAKADARASREAISLRTLLRAQSLRGHNGTVVPPPNLRWTFSVASGMLG